MNNELSENPAISLCGVLPMRRTKQYPPLHVKDFAFQGMTDFAQSVALTVAGERAIEQALLEMKRCGVRALLVVRDDSVVGLVTSYDIERFANTNGRCPVRVDHVMTPWSELLTVDWATMQSACVADLLEIFDGVGVMHLVVVEGHDGVASTVVRGLVSRTCIERRLRDNHVDDCEVEYRYQKAG